MIGTNGKDWLRGVDLNHRPLGYEPNELPDCSTPRFDDNNRFSRGQTCGRTEPVKQKTESFTSQLPFDLERASVNKRLIS